MAMTYNICSMILTTLGKFKVKRGVKRHENVSWDIYKVQENGFRVGKNLGPTQGTYKVVP